jgi:tetratricopeptide (TPR) repeat protein
MNSLKEKIKKFSLPVSPSTLIIIGYIFGTFMSIMPDKRKWGIPLFVITLIGHAFYLFSPEQKSSRLTARAKSILDKGNGKEGARMLKEAATLHQDEENLYSLFKGACKNVKSYKEAAHILEKEIPSLNTPYFRLLAASMYYYVGNVKKVVDILSKIPEEKRTIKVVRLLGSALFDLKEFDKSIEVLKEFDPPRMAITEDELAVQFGIGIAYARKGNRNMAITYLERVQERNSRFGNVTKILENLKSGS